MEIRIGKALGRRLRVPSYIARRYGLKRNALVKMSLRGSDLVISPAEQAPAALDELPAGLTKENFHEETSFGPPVGRETL